MSIFGGFYNAQGIMRVLPSIGLYNQKILQYNINGRIRSCRDGYTLTNDSCIIVTDNCDSYSSRNGLCIRCKPKFHLGPGRKCQAMTSSICVLTLLTG